MNDGLEIMAFEMLRQHLMYRDYLKKNQADIQQGQGQIVTLKQKEPHVCVSEWGTMGLGHPIERPYI